MCCVCVPARVGNEKEIVSFIERQNMLVLNLRDSHLKDVCRQSMGAITTSWLLHLH